ncbi:hypothetical protein NDU88_008930 [Pleurodeles waltl]|uniref:Uncharacterized protein n=1 Tax=Pleurodeles waltl TaxID=8319 RepID=A0AAV7PUJ0_PLEWA|nr:hypothetical protein NDU88_008930 [Pleurodeles waltl]
MDLRCQKKHSWGRCLGPSTGLQVKPEERKDARALSVQERERQEERDPGSSKGHRQEPQLTEEVATWNF